MAPLNDVSCVKICQTRKQPEMFFGCPHKITYFQLCCSVRPFKVVGKFLALPRAESVILARQVVSYKIQRFTWSAAVSDLEVFADVWTRILAKDVVTDRHLTSLLVVTYANNHLQVT